MTRLIAYVTGTRADYGLFSEPLKRIREQPDMLLALIVTSMHLEREFGLTVREIEADGMPVAAKIRNLSRGDTGGDQARSIAKAIRNHTRDSRPLRHSCPCSPIAERSSRAPSRPII